MDEWERVFRHNIDFNWLSDMFPYYADLDLEQVCAIDEILFDGKKVISDTCCCRIYRSEDGISFYRFEPGQSLRYLRIQIVDCMQMPEEVIREIQVSGIPLGEKGGSIEWMTPPEPFAETVYADPVTKDETEDYLYGLVERTVGLPYRSWFSFHLAEKPGNDSFRIYAGQGADEGKVCIEGNTGVALAAGLNYYYKNFCNVHISEQERQVEMPPQVVLPGTEIRKTAADRLRYAYNYCTLSYTMPFWGEEEWQKELDWLALNGVNLVMDFTGMEAVWYQFLKELSYTDGEIRNWIVGPCYTAWQQMQNMESFGGPVHPEFIRDRMELARRNQRKMRILGIQPIREGYAGMVPASYGLHDSEANVYDQGMWNGMQRPSMLDSTTQKYRLYAKRFYEIQVEFYGQGSHYYAIDPFHEGGVRPQNLTDDKIACCIMKNLLNFDGQAVWIVQAWRDNPTELFLEGVSGYRQEHMLILDLSATDNPHYGESEFQNTPWIYCMLDMYGGRLSTHGEPDVLAERIPGIRRETQYMKGIGLTSEATYNNPMVYELLFEMAWEEEAVDLDMWIQSYARRRYGALNPQIIQGWRQLLETAYRNPGYSHHGGFTQIFAYRPRLTMKEGQVFNELNSSILKKPYYNPRAFYLAVKCFVEGYDACKENACYVYDLQEFLRQMLNLLGTECALSILRSYHAGDKGQFEEAADRFFVLLDACDRLMGIGRDSLLGKWTGYAIDCGKRYDDFSKDLFFLNAKALITTWGYQKTYLQLADYAYRQYEGLLGNYYKKRWLVWIEHLCQALTEEREAEEISPETWFRLDWQFVLDDQEFKRVPEEAEPVLRDVIKLVQSVAEQLWNV